MSVGGIMRTSVSGMNAQANRLSAVSENIANSNTTGYKRSTTEFSSMVLPSTKGAFNSGVVQTETRTLISEQGGLSYTTNASSSQAIDLAISGKGYMIVGDGDGGTFLTRAGSFVKNGTGDLVNAAGFILQGYPLPEGDTNGVSNGFAGLQNVNLNAAELRLKPTDQGLLRVNLPKGADAVPTQVPGTGTTAAAATRTQASPFDITGATSAAGDRLTFTVALDGAAPQTVDIVTTGAGGVSDLTAADVAAAINTQLGASVATVDPTGRIALTSATTGAASSLALADVAMLRAGTGSPIAPGAIEGLTAFTAVTGSDAVPLAFAGTLPSANGADPTQLVKFTAKESIVVYDRTGKEVTLDIYSTKTAANTWEYAIFDRSNMTPGASGPFPYAGGPITAGPMAFDADGRLVTPAEAFIDLQIPDGQLMRLSLDGTTQLDEGFQTLASSVNGNPPENLGQIEISETGIVTAQFESGTTIPLFKIPLALVESPDNMKSLSGNVFTAGLESGTVLVGFGGESGLGSMISGALESSTVDLASELTTMIESQRGYTANSKVFQTGSEILDVLVNLKR